MYSPSRLRLWVSERLFPGLQFLAQAILLLPEFGSEFGAEVLHLKYLTKFDLAFFLVIRIGDALGPLDRLFHRLHLPYPETTDQFFRFRKRPVGHRKLAFGKPDARALRAWMKSLTGKHYTGLHQLFVVFPHFGQHLFAWHRARLCFVVCFD